MIKAEYYTVVTLEEDGDVYIQMLTEGDLLEQIENEEINIVNETLPKGLNNIMNLKVGSYIFGEQKVLKEKVVYEFI